MASVRYSGRWTRKGANVSRELEDGTTEPLPLRLDLENHSPTGFAWGYDGSGPAQLALAILSDAVGDDRAMHCGNYQAFKFAKIGKLGNEDWVITRDEVLDWFDREANV